MKKVEKTQARRIQEFVGRMKESKFNASTVQQRFGSRTELVHISIVRSVLGKMVKDGQLTIEGRGKGRKYVKVGVESDSKTSETLHVQS